MSKNKDYHTFVFVGPMDDTNAFAEEFCGMESTAWSRGHALEEKEQLEDFIRNLAGGEIENPEKAARELMNEMNWG